MTIIEALENALELLESEGFVSGDIHDDLKLSISRLKSKYPATRTDEL